MTLHNDALQAVRNTKIEYPVVAFPVRHTGHGWFRTANEVLFKWSAAGAGYLSERNTKYKYAQFTKLVRDEAWDELAALANAAITPIRGAGVGLIFAMVDAHVIGILRHYNMIDHKELLATIAECGMADDVIGWDLTEHYLSVDIAASVGSIMDVGELHVGVRMVNGHSGHHALQYNMLVKARGYEFTAPTHGRSRHLTGVSELKKVLKDALATIGTFKLDERLMNMSVPAFVMHLRTLTPTMTIRQETLIHLIETTDHTHAFDAFVLLGQYANTKGYSKAVSGLLDPLVKYLLEGDTN